MTKKETVFFYFRYFHSSCYEIHISLSSLVLQEAFSVFCTDCLCIRLNLC